MTEQVINSAKAKLGWMIQNPTACTWIDGLGWVSGLARVREIAGMEAAK